MERDVGSYRLLEKLGQGGMGAVYRAEHRRIPRQVAIKILLPELSSSPVLIDRFFAEARAAALIAHPSIVEIFDCDMQNGRAYIVMALLRGESLGAALRRAPMSVPEAVAIARDIARGMAAAHAAGIIHRDLKPDNVFLHAPDPSHPVQVKILDFGVAKLASQGGPAHTRTGSIIGTPLYMSPEQCRGAGRVDTRADIYSLGCILFEMLCGRPPFVSEGSGELIAAHLSEAPPSVTALRPSLPAALDALVRRALAKDADARFQTMVELESALVGLRTEDAAGVPPVGSTWPLVPVVEADRPEPERAGRQTTLSRAAGEVSVATAPATERVSGGRHWQGSKGRLAWVVGGVGVGLAMVAAILAVRGRAPSAVSSSAAHPDSVTVVPPELSTKVESPTAPAIARAPAIPSAPDTTPSEVREEVVVDVLGAPRNVAAWIDDQPTAIPLRLPRSTVAREAMFRAPGFAEYRISVVPDRDKGIVLSMRPSEGDRRRTGPVSAVKRAGPVTPRAPKLPRPITNL